MADNLDFHKVLVKNVTLQYPKLNSCYRFNTGKQQSEPCQPTANGAAWSISFDLPIADARTLHTELKQHYENCRARDPKLPPFAKVFGAKKAEDGSKVTFTGRRNGTKADGTANNAPKVIDGNKEPLENLAIWSGSKGAVRAWAKPSIDPDGIGGISLLLDTVQVTDPVYGDGGLDDFDVVAPANAKPAEYDDFGSAPTPAAAARPAARPAPEPQQPAKPLNEVLGDDIPF